MQLVNPLFLWALAGLAIPVGIHLLSRKEGKIIRLGSVRHVMETSTQQFKGIKLNEILLLALRCAMIVMFSLLLGGLQFMSSGNRKWVMVEKGLENTPALKPILDSLGKEGYELRVLSEKFSLQNDSGSFNSKIDYYKLMEELQTQNLSQAIVFSKNLVDDFKGLRPELPDNVRWISIASPDLDYPLQAIQINKDSIALRIGHTNSHSTYFTTEKVNSLSSSIGVSSPETINVVMTNDKGFDYDQKIIKAALSAIEKSIPIKFKLVEASPTKISSTSTDWCIWFSEEPIPKSIAKIISIRPQNSNELFVQESPNRWVITKKLNQEVALQKNLTLQLAELLVPKEQLQNIAKVNDRRMMPDAMAWTPQSNKTKIEASVFHEPADRYLVIVLLILLLTERIIAYKRNQ